jgi:N-formylglutamate deformylase
LASPPWNKPEGSGPLIATAIHNGHELRPSLAPYMGLDEGARLREEDPFTGHLAIRQGTHLIVERSRFEVDLNRPRDGSVYVTPDEAWGLAVWDHPLSATEIEQSRRLHDAFYAEVADVIESAIADHGFFVLYDIHSYNHRRAGAGAPPEDRTRNPSVNLGTGSLPHKWRAVADAFLQSMAADDFDVRENVKFEGGELSRWVHERYGTQGCALAIEFKKEFMDEWTGELLPGAIDRLGDRLDETVVAVLSAARRA